jgi:hypothetical protein
MSLSADLVHEALAVRHAAAAVGATVSYTTAATATVAGTAVAVSAAAATIATVAAATAAAATAAAAVTATATAATAAAIATVLLIALTVLYSSSRSSVQQSGSKLITVGQCHVSWRVTITVSSR